MNAEEALSITGKASVEEAWEELAGRTASPLITLGESGVFAGRHRTPGLSVEVRDTTGAGDTFAGGFMGYLSKAKKIDAASIKRALAYGTVAASFNVEGFGLERTARLTLKDLNSRLKKFPKMFI